MIALRLVVSCQYSFNRRHGMISGVVASAACTYPQVVELITAHRRIGVGMKKYKEFRTLSPEEQHKVLAEKLGYYFTKEGLKIYNSKCYNTGVPDSVYQHPGARQIPRSAIYRHLCQLKRWRPNFIRLTDIDWDILADDRHDGIVGSADWFHGYAPGPIDLPMPMNHNIESWCLAILTNNMEIRYELFDSDARRRKTRDRIQTAISSSGYLSSGDKGSLFRCCLLSGNKARFITQNNYKIFKEADGSDLASLYRSLRAAIMGGIGSYQDNTLEFQKFILNDLYQTILKLEEEQQTHVEHCLASKKDKLLTYVIQGLNYPALQFLKKQGVFPADIELSMLQCDESGKSLIDRVLQYEYAEDYDVNYSIFVPQIKKACAEITQASEAKTENLSSSLPPKAQQLKLMLFPPVATENSINAQTHHSLGQEIQSWFKALFA